MKSSFVVTGGTFNQPGVLIDKADEGGRQDSAGWVKSHPAQSPAGGGLAVQGSVTQQSCRQDHQPAPDQFWVVRMRIPTHKKIAENKDLDSRVERAFVIDEPGLSTLPTEN